VSFSGTIGLLTETVAEAVPIGDPVFEYTVAEIVCIPLATVVEFQLVVMGGAVARETPSM
jgi:hypothetical protein